MGFDCVDISNLATLPSTLRDDNIRIYAVRVEPAAEKPRRQSRAGRQGTKLSDVIAELESTEEGALEMEDGRQWVAKALYAEEPNSLQALRAAKGWSQGDLAKKLRTTQARISIYERGLEKPEFEMLTKMKNALGVDMNKICAAIEYATDRKGTSNA